MNRLKPNVKRIIILLLVSIILLLLYLPIVKAENAQRVTIKIDKGNIQKEEGVTAKIGIENIRIAALTLEIYFDNTKLEFLEGPENSNLSNNRIIYTWVSNNAKATNKLDIGEFKFKAIGEGIASIVVTGEGYSEDLEKIDIETISREVKIGRMNIYNNNEMLDLNKENALNKNNANLGILRLNHEGISPDFNSEIQEYYFVTEDNIEHLEITAIPENKNAQVTITGNRNLKMGQNLIKIEVESQDKTKKKIYKIHVTKTNNLEKANANLETLAIRQGDLVPEFTTDMTEYKIELPNEINTLDLLAIPENINAQTKIEKPETLKIGDNNINITVIAEDGTTKKEYKIIAHRRSKKEETQYEEKRKIGVEKLNTILESKQQEERVEAEKNINQEKTTNIEEQNRTKQIVLWITIPIAIIIITISILLYRKFRKCQVIDYYILLHTQSCRKMSYNFSCKKCRNIV